MHGTQRNISQIGIAFNYIIIQTHTHATGRPWDSCIICSGNMCVEGGQYYCSKCKKIREPSIYSTMTVIVTDASAETMQLILQPREIAQLCGISPKDLITGNKENEVAPTSEQICSLSGIQWCTQLELCNFNTSASQPNYVVQLIVQASKLTTKK